MYALWLGIAKVEICKLSFLWKLVNSKYFSWWTFYLGCPKNILHGVDTNFHLSLLGQTVFCFNSSCFEVLSFFFFIEKIETDLRLLHIIFLPFLKLSHINTGTFLGFVRRSWGWLYRIVITWSFYSPFFVYIGQKLLKRPRVFTSQRRFSDFQVLCSFTYSYSKFLHWAYFSDRESVSFTSEHLTINRIFVSG